MTGILYPVGELAVCGTLSSYLNFHPLHLIECKVWSLH